MNPKRKWGCLVAVMLLMFVLAVIGLLIKVWAQGPFVIT